MCQEIYINKTLFFPRTNAYINFPISYTLQSTVKTFNRVISQNPTIIMNLNVPNKRYIHIYMQQHEFIPIKHTLYPTEHVIYFYLIVVSGVNNFSICHI